MTTVHKSLDDDYNVLEGLDEDDDSPKGLDGDHKGHNILDDTCTSWRG